MNAHLEIFSISPAAADAFTTMCTMFTDGMGPLAHTEPRLAAALNDLLARPGSMLRSMAAYSLGVQFGLSQQAAKNLACGIEYLHTASLVFDDMPSMDDARTRRGGTCIHIVHGEATATLAALALINKGYHMLWCAVLETQDAGRRQRGADFVEARLGIAGVIGGQASDLKGWRGRQTVEAVSEVAARKTGDLLRMTLVLPAIIGDGSAKEILLLDRLAKARGLAYQAADDLKDVLFPDETNGKTAGRDALLGRPNLIQVQGLSGAWERYHRLLTIGDHLQLRLPGPKERWQVLHWLRVSLPPNSAALIKGTGVVCNSAVG